MPLQRFGLLGLTGKRGGAVNHGHLEAVCQAELRTDFVAVGFLFTAFAAGEGVRDSPVKCFPVFGGRAFFTIRTVKVEDGSTRKTRGTDANASVRSSLISSTHAWTSQGSLASELSIRYEVLPCRPSKMSVLSRGPNDAALAHEQSRTPARIKAEEKIRINRPETGLTGISPRA